MAVHRSLLLKTLLVTAVAAAGLTTVGAPSNAATPGELALTLVAPSAKQTIHRRKGKAVDLAQVAVYAVAGGGAVEFRSGRDRYDQPIRTTVTTGSGDARRTAELPPGTTSLSSLNRFLTMVVTNSKGKKVWGRYLDLCANSWSAARFRPSAPARSPYPTDCYQSFHPFALGSVQGVQDGWAVPALDEFGSLPMRQKNGKYTVTVGIAAPYRSALGVTKQQSSTTIAITIKNGSHMEEMSLRRAADTAPTPAAARPDASARYAAAAVAQGAVPDLRALPAFGIRLARRTVTVNKKKVKRSYVDFAATVWNAGPSPLVVDGFRRPGQDLMDAYQYFFDTDGEQVGSAPAGTLEWDARKGHTHWHFTDFARYSLLDAKQEKTVRSGKEAFCLVPTDAIDTRVPGADWNPQQIGLDSACGGHSTLALREVMEVGWGDTYDQSRPGQSLNVTTLPKGIYYVLVEANPENKLAEASTDNNRALRKIAIGGKPGGKRTLKVYPYQGIKD